MNPRGAATTYFFEWGVGAFDNTTPEREAGSGSLDIPVTEDLTDLDPLTTYRYRLVATSANGTDTGETLSFTTSEDVMFLVFAGHGYSKDVDVVDIESMTVVDTITDAGGYRIVFSPDGSRLYSTGGDGNIYISDAVGSTLLNNFDPSGNDGDLASDELEAVAISPDGSRVYFVDEQGYSTVYVLDTGTNQVIDAESLFEDEPENAVVSPDGQFLYIVDNTNALKVDLSLLQVVGRTPIGSDAHGVALSLDGSKLYARGVTSGIDVIDTASMATIGNIAGGNRGYFLELGKDGVLLYGVDESDGLSVMNTESDTLVENVTLSVRSARGVTTSPDGSTIFVATSSGLIKMDAATRTETGFLPGRYQTVAVQPAVVQVPE